MIQNDQLDSIRDDPDFGRKVYDAIVGFGNPETDELRIRSIGRVLSVAHADYQQLVSVGGNTGRVLTRDEEDAVLRVQRKARKASRPSGGGE
jgi:hypothetical protein